MGLFTVDVMKDDALVKRTKVRAERFIEAARAATGRPIREGCKTVGEWVLVTQYVSDRAYEFEFDD